jgi:hypothetical protein
VVIRDDTVDEGEELWSDSLEAWRRQVRAITGNTVEVLQVSAAEAAQKLGGRSELWRDIRRDGVVVFGAGLDNVEEQLHA